MSDERICLDCSMTGLEGGVPRVYTSVFPTITAREHKEPRLIMEVIQMGNLWGEYTKFKNKTSGRVYDKRGVSPALNTMQGGWKQPMIIDENIVIGGMQKHQAIKKDGICTTLTSVQKDNLVMESVKIKQATKDGYVECKIGGGGRPKFP